MTSSRPQSSAFIFVLKLIRAHQPRKLKFASGIFRFRGREFILLPPRKHSRGVVICQSWLLNFQGSPHPRVDTKLRSKRPITLSIWWYKISPNEETWKYIGIRPL